MLYYPGSENKGADQLRGYREADLRLCFRICKKPVLSRRGSYKSKRKAMNRNWYNQKAKPKPSLSQIPVAYYIIVYVCMLT